MTDQPIANPELAAEQLNSLSDAIASEISIINEFLTRAEQLCQSAQQSESVVVKVRQEIMEAVSGASIDHKIATMGELLARAEQLCQSAQQSESVVAKTRQEIMEAVSGEPIEAGALSDRVVVLEGQLSQLLESLPRLAQDVKKFAILAQHMDQCANEVNQWYHELRGAKAEGATIAEIQGHLLEVNNALQAYSQSHQALAEQIASLQGIDLSGIEAKIQALESSGVVGTLEQRVARLEEGSSATIDGAQIEGVVERVISEREQSLQNEMTTIQRDWQDGAAILQQMQVRIEALESKGGDATTAQLEAIRSEMTNLVAKSKTEQETALRDQRKRLEEMSSQGGKTTIALFLAVIGIALGVFGLLRR